MKRDVLLARIPGRGWVRSKVKVTKLESGSQAGSIRHDYYFRPVPSVDLLVRSAERKASQPLRDEEQKSLAEESGDRASEGDPVQGHPRLSD